MKDDHFFVCDCSYDFESDSDWNCWASIGEVIQCPVCGRSYRVEYDVQEGKEDGISPDIWWLEEVDSEG